MCWTDAEAQTGWLVGWIEIWLKRGWHSKVNSDMNTEVRPERSWGILDKLRLNETDELNWN